MKPGGHGGNGGNTGSGGTGLSFDARPGIDGIDINPTNCGNGVMDTGEQCDDGNKTAGDGCSAICQIPAGWTCSGSPSVCNMDGVCGDGIWRQRGLRRQEHDGRRRVFRRLQDRRTRLRMSVPTALRPACGDGMKIGGEARRRQSGERRRLLVRLSDRAGRDAWGQRQSTCVAHLRQRAGKGQRGLRLRHQQHHLPGGCNGPNGLFFGDATALEDLHEGRAAGAHRASIRRAPPVAATAPSRPERAATTATAPRATVPPTCTVESGSCAARRCRRRGAVRAGW